MATPEQCPDCGRFLSKAFVTGLAEADASCPKCGTTLTASTFGVVTEDPIPPDAPAPSQDRTPDPTSDAPDVLSGWDQEVLGTRIGEAAIDESGPLVALPAEAALGIGVVCAGAGFVIARRHPVWGAVLGAAAGIVLAAAGRTINQGGTT